jgi:tetratricopeptide (TPR) repeat protein
LIDVGLAEPLQHGHVRLHPALAPYLSGELTPEQHATAVSAWSEAMFQLVLHLYRQNSKQPQQTAELTLLESPNLLAALEHRFAVVESRLSRGANETESETNAAVTEQAATDLEFVIEMATSLEGLLQQLGRRHALRAAGATRVQAAARLQVLRGDNAWNHAQFLAVSENGNRLLEAGRHAEAVEVAMQLLIRSREAGESGYSGAAYDLAMARFTLGRTLRMAGSAQAALEPLTEARTHFQRLALAGDADAVRMTSVSLTDYADCLADLGRLDEAGTTYQQAIDGSESRDDRRQAATAKAQLGTVRLLQRKYAEALVAYDEARQTFERLGEPGSVATAWHQIGVAHQGAGQFEAAEHAYQQTLHIRSSHGDRSGEGTTLNQLGRLYGLQSRHEEAVRLYRQAADIFAARESQNLAREGAARNNAASQLIKLSRYDEARREILRTIACLEPLGHASKFWQSFAILSDLEEATGNAAASAAARDRAVQAYLAYRRDGGENHNTGGRLALLVQQALASGDTAAASAEIAVFEKHPDLPNHPSLQALLPSLKAILNGSRDPALATDPRLHFDDAAEVQFLLERLA